MKKLILPLIIICVGLMACEEDGINVSFNVDYSTNYTLDKAAVVGTTIDAVSPEIQTNNTEVFTNNNTNLDKIEGAKFNNLTISIISPAGEDFSFVNDVKVYIQGLGMSEELVASKSNIDQAATSIDMDVTDVNLAAHVKSGAFTLRTSVVNDEALDVDLDLQADMQMKVTARAL